MNDNDDDVPPKIVFDGSLTQDKVPGKDGVLVADPSFLRQLEEQTTTTTTIVEEGPTVVSVSAGDAVVFYNYEYNEELESSIMSWRSLHCGMPAQKEKWIATNWIQQHTTVSEEGRDQ